MQLYDKIFQVANENMQTSGQEFSFGKMAFESILYKNPGLIEASEFRDMPREEFLPAVYLRCLNRLPDSSAKKIYENLLKQNNEDEMYVYYAILTTVGASTEFKNLNKKLVGLLEWKFVMKGRGVTYRFKVKWLEVKAKLKYLFHHYIFEPIWKRLPNNVKNVIRVMCGRGKK